MKLEQLQQTASDLITHFITNLHKQINDVGDTAERIGLDDEIIMQIIMTGLVYELVKAARHLEMSEKDFQSLVGTMYREVERVEGKV